MEFGMSDSSGTDDDLPPQHPNKFARARVSGNGKSAVAGPTQLPRTQNDMETQIHLIEQDAYSSVLRAFKAQSDAITWEKESLITELRKELRVSDDEHRELLSRVNADDTIRRIREWRKVNGHQPGMFSAPQSNHDNVPSPTNSFSHKKQKASQPMVSLSAAPSPALHPSMQPSSSTLKRGPPSGPRDKKTKQNYSSGLQGRALITNYGNSGGFGANESTPSANFDLLIGRKVWTRWPEDNTFYEAVISNYDPIKGLHLLTYDIGTPNEAYEWVDIKEISPEDIRWGSEDVGNSQRGGRGGGAGRGVKKKSGARSSASAGRGRGTTKGQSKKDSFLSQNGIGNPTVEIELLHTDALIKEVERIFSANPPDPSEVEKAKKVLKEHEQALVDAIARLEDASDGESDGDHDHPFSQGQLMGQDQTWQKRQYDEMGAEGRGLGGPNSEKIARASDKQQQGGDDV